MTKAHGYLKDLLANLRAIRIKAGLSEEKMEERLILGPGWIKRFEEGESVPSIDMLLAMLGNSGATLRDLLAGLSSKPDPAEIERQIYAEQKERDLLIRFQYADFDAAYHLKNADLKQFDTVVKTLRDGLALLSRTDDAKTDAIKTDAVAKCFLKAAQIWPDANPSDLWWFLVYRAYCDPYNHPARFARLDFTQSWKRTGGWALEEVLVRHYGPFLKSKGINIFIADAGTKQAAIRGLKLKERIEADKIDVMLTIDDGRKSRFLGVVHVKASFAERRTDDVPMSAALVKAGFTSPLWTMDCKSSPGASPVNRGELGEAEGDYRSAKRKDIEDEGYFTGCFSYNANTIPTKLKRTPERQIFVCDFRNPDDAFSRFILKRSREFRHA